MINDNSNKMETFTEKGGNFPNTKIEISRVLDQLVTKEITTYVLGEEWNHNYPLSTMYAGSETYNSVPNPSNKINSDGICKRCSEVIKQ